MPFHGGLDWGGAAMPSASSTARDRWSSASTSATMPTASPTCSRGSGASAAPAELPVAIERPSGLVVETLVAAGHPVVPIHPNVVKACRPRYRAAGGKSDPGDAYMLADILRTDGHRFAPLTPVSDEIKALRALVRGRDDLVAARVALANQLRSLLEGFWPGAAAIFAEIDSPIALAFLGRFPTPDSARRLGEKRLAAFLAQHRYCGRRTPDELLARLRAAPTGLAGEAEADAKRRDRPRPRRHPRAPRRARSPSSPPASSTPSPTSPTAGIVMSFPRAGRICAAQILAELGDVRERFQTDDQLAAEAGVSPVTHASGKSRGVVFRWACNHRLRAAVTCWADNSRHASPWAADVYRRARHAAATIRTRSASSRAPGSASSGAPGRTASPTTRTARRGRQITA